MQFFYIMHIVQQLVRSMCLWHCNCLTMFFNFLHLCNVTREMVQGVILKLFILNIGSVIMLLNVPGGGGRGLLCMILLVCYKLQLFFLCCL